MVIFINQIRMKIGVMFGSPETTTGGNALKFYASVRLDIRRIGAIKGPRRSRRQPDAREGGEEQGRPAVPQVDFDIMYGEGISKARRSWSIWASRPAIVEKSGSWYSYGDQRIGQGRDNVREFLRKNRDIAGAIETAVRCKSENTEEELLVGDPEGDEADEGEP